MEEIYKSFYTLCFLKTFSFSLFCFWHFAFNSSELWRVDRKNVKKKSIAEVTFNHQGTPSLIFKKSLFLQACFHRVNYSVYSDVEKVKSIPKH